MLHAASRGAVILAVLLVLHLGQHASGSLASDGTISRSPWSAQRTNPANNSAASKNLLLAALTAQISRWSMNASNEVDAQVVEEEPGEGEPVSEQERDAATGPLLIRNAMVCSGLRCMERVQLARAVCAVSLVGDYFLFKNLCDVYWFSCMIEQEFVPKYYDGCPGQDTTSPHPSTSTPTIWTPTTSPPTTLPPTTLPPTTLPPYTSPPTPLGTFTYPTFHTATFPPLTSNKPTTSSRHTFPTYPIAASYPTITMSGDIVITHSPDMPPIAELPNIDSQDFVILSRRMGRRVNNNNQSSSNYQTQTTKIQTSEMPVTAATE